MTELQRDTLAYGVVAAASACLLVWIIPAHTPEYPGYGVPASLLPDIAAGFMLALSLLGLGRAALSRRKAGKSGGGFFRCYSQLASFNRREAGRRTASTSYRSAYKRRLVAPHSVLTTVPTASFEKLSKKPVPLLRKTTEKG